MTDSAPSITKAHVLRDPEAVVRELLSSNAVYGLQAAEVRLRNPKMVVLGLTLAPWAPMAERGYPIEQVAITVFAGRARGRGERDDNVLAVPFDAAGRSWQHRYPTFLGELCLWDPTDPRPLRWEWDDGLVAYIAIVHRHLQAEEFFRRTGEWPAEDAPHGPGPHPIRSLGLRYAIGEAI